MVQPNLKAWIWPLALALGLHAWALTAWWPSGGTPDPTLDPAQNGPAPLQTRSVQARAVSPPVSPAPKSATKPVHQPFLDRNQPFVAGSIGLNAIKSEPPVSTERPALTRIHALPAPAQVRYQVSGQHRGRPIDSVAELNWQHDGANFSASLDIGQWFGAPRDSRSTGTVGAHGLSPARYSERSRGERAVHIDAALGRVSYSNNRADAPWVDGMQDPLSVIMQFAAWLTGDSAQFRPGQTVSVPTTGLGSASPWLFAVDTPAVGELPTRVNPASALKFTRELRGEFDAKLELWFATAAPAPDWQLARMRVTRHGGDVVDLRLQP